MYFGSMAAAEKHKWILDNLNVNSQVIDSRTITKYIVAGKEVCKDAWCRVLPVSTRTVSTILTSVGKGQVSYRKIFSYSAYMYIKIGNHYYYYAMHSFRFKGVRT